MYPKTISIAAVLLITSTLVLSQDGADKCAMSCSSAEINERIYHMEFERIKKELNALRNLTRKKLKKRALEEEH